MAGLCDAGRPARAMSAIALIVVAGWSASASADIVTEFDFTGQPGTQTTQLASTVDPNLAADPVLSKGSGLVPGRGVPNSFGAQNWQESQPGPASTDYFSFTLTPIEGYFVEVTDILAGVIGLGNGAPTSAILRSSLDGFSVDLDSVPITTTATDQTFQLSSPLAFTEAVEFRIFATGAGNTEARFALTSASGAAGLVINGTVAAVPEPSSSLLIGTLCLVATGVRVLRGRQPIAT